MNPKGVCIGIKAYLMIRRGNADGILMKFGNAANSAPFPSMVVIYRKNEKRGGIEPANG